tara:strand:+ start:111 stop:593 length:483 start_codon:yes stop_codon:yes gene_type:complete
MCDLLNNNSVKRVKSSLDSFDKSLKIQILNQSARTATEASNALGCDVGAIVKSLLIKTETSFILCLISGDKKCSLKKLKKLTSKKDVCMANAEDVKKITGFTIGGVSPVGLRENLDIMIDLQLQRYKKIYAAAGHPNAIFEINLDKLIKITNGELIDISE